MRDLHRIYLALATTLVFVQPAFTDEMMSEGELAAAIRSADYPCDHVLEMQAAGENGWLVQCNSGTYQVTRDANDQFTVVKADWPAG